ncbi:hypothetical protein HKD37_09G025192 [Glycine soja]
MRVKILQFNPPSCVICFYKGCVGLSWGVMKSHESIWWRDLKLVCGGSSDGNEGHTRFWQDCWVRGECFQTKFPRLFLNSKQKGKLVRNMGSWSPNGWRWEFSWRSDFLNVLTNVNIANHVEDFWLRLEDSSIMYSVKFAYVTLHDLRVDSSEIDISKGLWHLKIPNKVAFLLWRDSIPTKSNLVRRGVLVDGGDPLCIFCLEMVENEAHLLFTCSTTHLIWKKWFNLFGISSTLPFLAMFSWLTRQLLANRMECNCLMLFEGKNFEIEQTMAKNHIHGLVLDEGVP